ncbi:LysR substrate-binding domain-containing protein [Pseudarthrobacter sp. PS3-L1]|uniref:LysR substrate-binding domain-containing protein n=1 Tax=Pseudarthrobacter sp. PS3-L1 TaxID=3046207 RepID=UPI0024B913DE|nr:LysR substrate-binding domain-containing protein [Pseudarthrobacter sp. PS3-L1]MDJ0320718.1 LysR substrate-binding domain-containing protein [Pseudarthrobacter sp. PS3-L1]
MFTFDQLSGFIAVAEELHFGRAAERLTMTQPPLSRQVQKLERSLGVVLFERDNRRVSLTAAGSAFLAEARRLMALADRAPRSAQTAAAGGTGVLSIGFTAAGGFSVLGPLLRRLDETLPGVSVTLHELVTQEQLGGLESGELDLGLARPPFNTDQYGSCLLNSEALVLAVPTSHPLVTATRNISGSSTAGPAGSGRPVTDDELRGLPLIMHSPIQARYFYDLVVRTLPVQHGDVVHTVSQILTMVSLVAAGRGVAFVPESTAHLGIQGVSYLQMESGRTNPAELHVLWKRSNANPALSKAVGMIIDHY